MGYFSSSEMWGGSPYVGGSIPHEHQFIVNLSGSAILYSDLGINLLHLATNLGRVEAIPVNVTHYPLESLCAGGCAYQDDHLLPNGLQAWSPTDYLCLLQIMKRREATEYLAVLPGGKTEIRSVSPGELEQEFEKSRKAEEARKEKKAEEEHLYAIAREERREKYEKNRAESKAARRNFDPVLSYRSIVVKIEKVLGLDLDDTDEDIGVTKDGRRFRLRDENGGWVILYEEKQFLLVESDEGVLLSATIKEFISSQYQDGERFTREILYKDFRASKSRSPQKGVDKRNRWKSFCVLFPNFSRKIEKRAEKALVELLQETRDGARVLYEDNGVFHWKTAKRQKKKILSHPVATGWLFCISRKEHYHGKSKKSGR